MTLDLLSVWRRVWKTMSSGDWQQTGLYHIYNSRHPKFYSFKLVSFLLLSSSHNMLNSMYIFWQEILFKNGNTLMYDPINKLSQLWKSQWYQQTRVNTLYWSGVSLQASVILVFKFFFSFKGDFLLLALAQSCSIELNSDKMTASISCSYNCIFNFIKSMD